MSHKYDNLVEAIHAVFREIHSSGIGDVLSKGGIGTILLAHHLSHELIPGDKGADARDAAGHAFEYKVSNTNQFNFNFGGRPISGDVCAGVRQHFEGITGAYCGLRRGARFIQVAYCPTAPLLEHLIKYFERSQSKTLVKNFSIEAFLRLPGATQVEVKHDEARGSIPDIDFG